MNKIALAVNELCVAVECLHRALHAINPNSIAQVEMMGCCVATDNASALLAEVMDDQRVEVPHPAVLGAIMKGAFQAAGKNMDEVNDVPAA